MCIILFVFDIEEFTSHWLLPTQRTREMSRDVTSSWHVYSVVIKDRSLVLRALLDSRRRCRKVTQFWIGTNSQSSLCISAQDSWEFTMTLSKTEQRSSFEPHNSFEKLWQNSWFLNFIHDKTWDVHPKLLTQINDWNFHNKLFWIKGI